MTKVVVTGAAGFIGGHLARSLARSGAEVHGIDVRPLSAGARAAGVCFHEIDIRESAAVRSVVDGADVVHHLASAHLEVNAAPSVFEEVNIKAAANLVEACAAAGVRRLVHTSSVGIYGHVEHPPASEETAPAPRNVYERTKAAGEVAVLEASRRHGVDVVVLRPAWVYGSGCRRTAKLMGSVRRGRFFYIGDGANLRHPVHIEDLLDAYELAACARSDVAGTSYNIAGPRAMPLRELVETCATVLGVQPPRHSVPRIAGLTLGRCAEIVWKAAGREPPFSRRSLTFFESDNAFDTSAALRDLGFRALIDLAEGLGRIMHGDRPAVVA
jgi:nucleoside-diphosphate-sugar epimerase